MPESNYYRSSYGPVRLWIARLSTDKSRTQVVHELSVGDDHVVQDRGQVILRARATLLFDWMNGDLLSPVDRLNEFKSLAQSDDLHVFTHPIEGSFNARVGSFNYDVDENGNITAEVEFIAAEVVRSVIESGAASIPASGEGLVEAAADSYTAEYEELGLEDLGLGEASKVTADEWISTTDPNPREIFTENGAYASQLSGQAEQLENDLDAWQAYKSTLLLADAVRTAAESATADTASTFVLKLASNQALRPLLAAEYGADEVDVRYSQVMKLNDIATPALIDLGTELQLPSPKARARNG